MRKAEPFSLVFDVGNTHTKMGIATRDALAATYTLASDRDATGDVWGERLAAFIRHAGFVPENTKSALCSSVVPLVNEPLASACARFLGTKLLFVPADAPVELVCQGASTEKLGADRVLGCYAARTLYPEHEYHICIDFGTATTFDCIRGVEYLGGVICPGVLSAAEGLTSHTSLLPRIRLDAPDHTNAAILGKTTESQLTYGFVYGFAGLTEGIVRRMRRETSEKAFVVATGGFAGALATETSVIDCVRPDLLLEGGRRLLQKMGIGV